MFWYFLRCLFAPYVKIFFRRAQGKNLNNLRVKNPVLIALTHPNAFMDPIGFSCVLFSPRTFYMARGDAFKKGIVSSILTATGIIPIFRMRDAGIEGVKKNNESFSIAYRIWNRNHKIMVFAEGLCVQERRLRPIQKGTARMAFGFMEEYRRDDFLIVPVSVTYSHPTEFRGDIYFEAGEAIAVKDFSDVYKENPAKAINQLTKLLEDRMKKIVPHLNHQENDIVIEELQAVYKHQFLAENGLKESKLEDQQVFWNYTIGRLNRLTETDPAAAEQLRLITSAYTRQLSMYKIQDINIYKDLHNTSRPGISLLMLILGFPTYAVGKLINFIPWFLAQSIAKKTAKNIEFYTSVNFVSGLFLSGFYFIAELLTLWFVFKMGWLLGAYTLAKVAVSLLALAYSARKKYWTGELRTARLRHSDPDLLNKLKTQRSVILSILTGK
jgi:1-acyl-sn-glycerol-3-phosphate acyltransferase